MICLTSAALSLFLAVTGLEPVWLSETSLVVPASDGSVVYVWDGEIRAWCVQRAIGGEL